MIFFLDIKEEYSPIGFIRAPSHVTAVCWSPWPKFKLLVCCEDGSMMEVEAPIKGLRNISKTYHLDSLGFSSLKFAPIKDRLRVSDWDGGEGSEEGEMRVLLRVFSYVWVYTFLLLWVTVFDAELHFAIQLAPAGSGH